MTPLTLFTEVAAIGIALWVAASVAVDARGIGYALRMRLWLAIFAAVGMLAIIFGLAWLAVALVFAPEGKRAMDIILALDRLGNATTGGDGRETISSRIGRLQEEGTAMPKWSIWLGNFLDWLEPNHCKNAIGG